MASSFEITAPGERPYFPLVAAFLWGDARPFDSDGDSSPLASLVWTELTLIPRDDSGHWIAADRFDVDPIQHDPLVLKVVADNAEIAARVAYLLANYTQGQIRFTPDSQWTDPAILLPLLGTDFDLDAALDRFRTSRYHEVTEENK